MLVTFVKFSLIYLSGNKKLLSGSCSMGAQLTIFSQKLTIVIVNIFNKNYNILFIIDTEKTGGHAPPLKDALAG